MQMKKIRVLLVKPRGFCAGVARAVEAVDSLLDHVRPHVYALHEIVHNRTLVADFERRGVIFVSSISSIPRGAVAVFSAHGVSPAARREAARRELRVLDCTCPLVAKVHAEARRYQESGYRIVLLGREGHDEVEGVWGEAPGRITLVSTPEQASNLRFEPGDKVAYLVQTTWTPDEARSIVEILRRRAPQIEGPAKNDICYATQNRQNALRAVAREADVVLVAGSANSCNSSNLAAVARAEGSVSYLLDDAGCLDSSWFDGVATVAITSGTSVPETVVSGMVAWLHARFSVTVEERVMAMESVYFTACNACLKPVVEPRK